jgi:putative transposase
MKRLQAYKYELKTNLTQDRLLRRFAGSCRFVFNKALALQRENHEAGNKLIGYVAMAKMLTEWRHTPGTNWLSDSPVHPLQHALKDLEQAYKNFFAKRADFPRFKKKGQGDSFRYPDPKQFKVDQVNSRVFLPKVGWIRYRNSRAMEGTPKNITVSRYGDHWYISVQTEREIQQPIHPSASIVGIDVGIAKFATLSDGTVLKPVNSFKKHQQRLARLQRTLSRKKKFSSNWKKAKKAITKLHMKIANTRKDYLHKTTTAISQNHAVVCIEDLKIKNMSKSACGYIEKPGRNVKAKSGLNRSILDQGWFEFRRQLEYKQAWLGGEVLAISARNTSRRCSLCGHTEADNRTSQPRFRCMACGHEANADVNAACNILAAGHAVLACGEIALSGFSVKQEPTEATQVYA